MNRDFEQYILLNFAHALSHGIIKPYYQPVIRTISRQLCSFEALARWVDPELGILPPDVFVPVLEEHRLIHELDSCIIRQVCRHLRTLIEEEKPLIPVSVNLSRRDFELCDVFGVVNGIVTEYRIPHDSLYIEITESVMAEKEDMMHEIVGKFRRAGYQVWMDDFGSAYSSLNVLKDYDFNEIKMDMRFLRSFDRRSQKILTAVVQMAKDLEIQTLAEGVETEEQEVFLRNIGCEKVQGFYYGGPLPYEEALTHILEQGVTIEQPQERWYYDEIGRTNILSAVPFMGAGEREKLHDALKLNSIPLAVAEGRKKEARLLFCNTAYEEAALSTGLMTDIIRQDLIRVWRPMEVLPAKLLHLMESAQANGEGRMSFTRGGEYYELRAKCIAKTRDSYCLLLMLGCISQSDEAEKTQWLDEGIRQVYTLYERITLIDSRADVIKPLYVTAQEDLLSGRKGIRALSLEYARRWIFPDDRKEYLALVNWDTLEERLRLSGRSFLSRYLRTRGRHGEYTWKQYTLLALSPGIYAELIRNVHDDLLAFEGEMRSEEPGNGEGLSAQMLFRALVHSDILRLFWKDADRRFVGASRAFLDYYGFASLRDIQGKNDEDLGWHISPEGYMNDELRVIHEGVSTYNVPGRCIRGGENRDILASKTPVYDENGTVRGLLGYFIDRDMLAKETDTGRDSLVRDMLTGLLNSRGLWEESEAFQDAYNLREIDFVRLHLGIDDFSSITRTYGFSFGDQVIIALGRALKEAFGHTAAVGRFTGHQFVVLKQVTGPDEVEWLTRRLREIASQIREINGVSLTLYISVGSALYSKSQDAEKQSHAAEIRYLADHDEHSTVESRLRRAAELFHTYDNQPFSYSVYRVKPEEKTGKVDVMLFYVNHAFEKWSGLPAKELVGRRVRELFPAMGEGWYEQIKRAALQGETILDKIRYAPTGKDYLMTMSPILREGYCGVIYQEMDVLDSIR